MHTPPRPLLILDPRLMSYRVMLWNEVNITRKIVFICSDIQNEKNINFDVKIVKKRNFFGLSWYQEIIKIIKNNRVESVLISSDIKNLSMWAIMIYCKYKKIDCFLFGHGLHGNKKHKNIRLFCNKVMLILVKKYLCYTEGVRQTMLPLAKNVENIDNTIINQHCISPSEKTGNEFGILFVGRIREGTDLDLLINAVQRINQDRIECPLQLHLVGPDNSKLSKIYGDNNIKYYGEMFDDEEIANISKLCRIGIYPGNAGLSVIHYMSLSLPPIVHNDINSHGPEVEAVIEKVNGFTFVKKNELDLARVILEAFTMDKYEFGKIIENSYHKYYEKVKPTSYAQRIVRSLI